MELNKEQLAIMRHTATTPGRVYCGDSPDMQALVKDGYMESAGRKSFVVDEYFRLTLAGKEFLRLLREFAHTVKMMDWNSGEEEFVCIIQIADRAVREESANDFVTVAQDVAQVHWRGCPLRLEDFRDAEDAVFHTEIFRIVHYLDRTSGKLKYNYVPRFAVSRVGK